MKNLLRKNNFVIITASSVLLLLLAFFCKHRWSGTYRDIHDRPVAEDYATVFIEEGDLVSQAFSSFRTSMNRVQLYLITASDAQGNLCISLTDAHGNTVISREIPLDQIPSAEWFTILSDIKIRSNRPYTIDLHLSQTGGNTGVYIILTQNNTTVRRLENAILNDEIQFGSLFLDFNFSNTPALYSTIIAVLAILYASVVLTLLLLNFSKGERKT